MNKKVYGIRNKILLLALVLIFGLSFSFLLVMLSFVNEEREAIIDIGMNNVSKMSDSMDSLFQDIKEDTDSIIIDSFVQKCIFKDELNVKEKENLLHNLLMYTDDVQSSTYYIKNSGQVYSYSGDRVNLNNKEFDRLLSLDYAKLHLFWQPLANVYSTKKDDSVELFAIRNVRSIDTLFESDRILIEIKSNLVDEVLNACTDNRFSFYLIGPDRKIYAKKCQQEINNETLFKIEESILNEGMVKIDEGYVFSRYHVDGDMYLVSYISDKEVYKSVENALGWMFIFMGMAIIFAIGFSFSAAKRFSEPVQMISKEMQDFSETSLSKEMHIDTNTELDEIGKSYNTMLHRIKYLMTQVQTKEKEARRLEMESLMYQIHPHFLYNTLENIYMLARINKQEKIMIMVDSLSKLLRITLSNGNNVIEIEEELTHVKSYLDIQQFRNNNMFDYEIICQDKLCKYKVPKLILQPIVENSIKHGFANMEEGGKISIEVKQGQGNSIIFLVSDNGSGMDAIKLRTLNESIKNADITKPASKEGGYGVINVARRLKIMCQKVDMVYSYENGTRCFIELVMDEDYMDES